VRSRGAGYTLCIDLFGTPPLVTLEERALAAHGEPGFIRAAAAALRGSTLVGARARKGDRLLRLTFGTRSRFGVGDETDLYIELVPRFGNVILVRHQSVVAALKEFSLAQNPARAIEAGAPYRLPPLVLRTVSRGVGIPEDASVLEAFTAYRAGQAFAGERQRGEERRRALQRRLDERERKIHRELDGLAEKKRAAADSDTLRNRAEAIYAHLHELDPGTRDAAKQEASALFARYKKLRASQTYIDAREQALRTALEAVAQLRWEAECADESDLSDVEDAVAALDPRSQRAPAMVRTKRKRAPLEVRTPSGSRILIGRSPSENAELTFRVARPNDWWFHAQNVPGAHVILQRADRGQPPQDDLDRAASLAAYYSKARGSAKVPIDYTMRKNVRAQRNAPPGLVWYTHRRTIVAAPAPP